MAKNAGFDPSYGKLFFKTCSPFILSVAVGQNLRLTKDIFLSNEQKIPMLYLFIPNVRKS